MAYSLVWWDRDADSWGNEVDLTPSYDIRTLIKENGIYKTFNGTAWEEVGQNVNLNVFKTKGMANDEQDVEYFTEVKSMDYVSGTQGGKIFKTAINLNDNFNKLL